MEKEITWSIDQRQSEIAFMVKHLMVTHVKGTFEKFDADITTTGKDFTTAVIDLSIDVNSITTGDLKRDEHLKDADFFDVKKHRQIEFRSNTIARADSKGNHDFWGELTIKGVSRAVRLSAQFGWSAVDPTGVERIGFTVNGSIKRSDWGLNWNSVLETGGLVLGDEVVIACEIELINASTTRAGLSTALASSSVNQL